MFTLTDSLGLLELKLPLKTEPKNCINTIKVSKECSSCIDICPTKAIDPTSLVPDASACTLCGACAFICPTKAIELNLDHIGFIKSLKQDEVCIGCLKSDKAEIVIPCILNINEKDILGLQNKNITFDVSFCESCTYGFYEKIKTHVSKIYYISKIFRLNIKLSTNAENYTPKFRRISHKEGKTNNFSHQENLCQNTVPFESRFGIVEISSDCDICGACASICPSKAIKIEDGMIKFSHGLCIACGLCEYACFLSNIKKPLSLRKAIKPSDFKEEYKPISMLKKHTCENCGKSFYSNDDIHLCLYCKKEQNLNNMIIDFITKS